MRSETLAGIRLGTFQPPQPIHSVRQCRPHNGFWDFGVGDKNTPLLGAWKQFLIILRVAPLFLATF